MYIIEAAAAAWAMEAKVKALRWNKKGGLLPNVTREVIRYENFVEIIPVFFNFF